MILYVAIYNCNGGVSELPTALLAVESVCQYPGPSKFCY